MQCDAVRYIVSHLSRVSSSPCRPSSLLSILHWYLLTIFCLNRMAFATGFLSHRFILKNAVADQLILSLEIYRRLLSIFLLVSFDGTLPQQDDFWSHFVKAMYHPKKPVEDWQKKEACRFWEREGERHTYRERDMYIQRMKDASTSCSDIAPTNKIVLRRASSEQRQRTRSCHDTERETHIQREREMPQQDGS